MAVFIRWISAIMAVLVGLPTLASSVVQSAFNIGYGERPVSAAEENYLPGSETFIDEAPAEYWSVGYCEKELTPDDVTSHRYFLGGYLRFPAQEATGVLDELNVRAVVLDDNSGRGAVALAWIDCVGFMNADVKAIREKLSDITGNGELVSIDVGSTHTHSAVDTQGLWGNIPKSGRDEAYIAAVVEKTAEAIREAYESRTQGTLYYSAGDYGYLFSDGRAPEVYDEKIHLFRFVPLSSDKKEIYIANFGAHPVNVDYQRTELSGDYPYYLELEINARADAEFMFIQGAIGGGINCRTGAANGITEELDDIGRIKAYAATLADALCALAEKGEIVEPILNVTHSQVDIEVSNFIFKLAERAGLCNAVAFRENGKIYLTTEIGYLEIGKNVKILQMPGEVLPEVVYGGFLAADEAYNGTEYEYAALASRFAEGDDVLVFGLCNDALGYIVPDNDYSASNEDGHYEETVSTGGAAASTISKAFHALLDIWG